MFWIRAAIVVAVALVALLVLVRLLEPRFAFFPVRGEDDTPRGYGVDYEPLTIETSDGERLRAWLLAHPAPAAFVVYFHGNGGNLSMWAPIVAGLAREGYTVLAVDYRGYGASTGRPTERGLYRDVEATVAHVRASTRPPSREPGGATLPASRGPGGATLPASRGPGGTTRPASRGPGGATRPPSREPGGTTLPASREPGGATLSGSHPASASAERLPLIYWGRSLGASMAAYAAARHRPAGVILESGFPDARSLLRASPPMAFLALFSSYRFPAARYMREAQVPALVIHGDADRIVPFDQGRALFDAIPEPKQFFVVPGGDHNDARPPNPVAYWKAVNAFVAGVR